MTQASSHRLILSNLGLILASAGIVILTPLISLIIWPSDSATAWSFLIPASALIIIGGFSFWHFHDRTPAAMSVKDGSVIVFLSWLLVTAASAYPFMDVLSFDFTRAYFESVSGWTTTGLSVVDVTAAPKIILLWRSIMQLAGGAGIAIILVASAGGPLGPGLIMAEGRSDQLVPHVKHSARLVFKLYAGYAIIGVTLLHLVGMNWFDAVNHAFAAISTGGFSTYPESIGYWDSAAVEAATIVLMILGSLNFQTVYILVRGRFRLFWRNGEVRLAVFLALVFIPLTYLALGDQLYPELSKRIRVSIFEVISAITTTGFSTTGYSPWPVLAAFILVPLMIIGGATGSTAGGVKQHRVYTIYKAIVNELRRMRLPGKAVLAPHVWRGEEKYFFSDSYISQLAVFIFTYLTIYVSGSMVLMANGYSVKESLFEYASALGTVGLSLGVTSISSPDSVLWAESIGMFLGRLEIMIVLLAVWRLFRGGRS